MAQMDITIAGVGGQGSILAGVILGTAAVTYGSKYAVQTQAYSSELRGGFAATWVIVSDDPIDFPRVIAPDILVAQAQDAIKRFAKTLKPKGLLVIDSDMIPEPPAGIGQVIRVPATNISRQEFKNPVVANMVMLGALWQTTRIVGRPALEKAIADHVPPGKDTLNIEAFTRGARFVEDQMNNV